MRKIKIESWNANIPVRDKEGKIIETKESKENLLIALNILIATKAPDQMPKGLEQFRIFSKLAEAFDKADKSDMLELEEREYNFLKEVITRDIPSAWGMNKNLTKAIESFLEAK